MGSAGAWQSQHRRRSPPPENEGNSQPQDQASRNLSAVCAFHPRPAPTHVDGTGRLQTVTREANPRYHALISAFRDLTGVPVVLNTSFNDNEPIVCRPEEAIDCFLRTQMDALVLGDFLICRA